MVKTHKDYLIENHGLAPEWNPRVQCACGRFTSADMCVDLSPLPIEMRQALGLEAIDYLCDGCITRLFREQLVNEDEFYALLGAETDALFAHNERDREHVLALAERIPAHRPRFGKVTEATALARVTEAAVDMVTTDGDGLVTEPTAATPIIPLKFREMRNQQSAQFLAYKYTLTNVEQPPDRS